MTLSGIGYDVHRFATNRPLIVGGVEIPYHLGLEGHSDADVLSHAIADAVLGASSGHRRDGTCCLGQGTLAAQPAEVQARRTQSGCGGSCGDGAAAAPALIQIQRSR